MNILDKIKEFFQKLQKKDQTLYLPVNNTINNQKPINKYAVKLVGNPKEPTLEECIDEFIKQYLIQERDNPKRSGKAYRAFRGMFCTQEEMGNNDKNQIRLKEFVRRQGYSIAHQFSNGRIAYMHISGKDGIDEKRDKEAEKLYINCDRKNIAVLTGAIFNKIRDIAGDKLQMKCISEQYMEEHIEEEERNAIKNYQRNDKIVIYAEDSIKAQKMAEKINELRTENPELFTAIKSTPILQKKLGFIGTAKNTMHFQAKTPSGYATGRTYNDFLSDVMLQSVVSAFDNELTGTSSGHDSYIEERMSQYVSLYPQMIPEQRNDIISKSKLAFLQICQENRINTTYRAFTEKQQDSLGVFKQ